MFTASSQVASRGEGFVEIGWIEMDVAPAHAAIA